AVAANAADGVVWRLSMTDNGLFTRHGFAHNVIHVLVSDHPRAPGSSTVKVWTRCPYSRDSILFGRPTAYQDTRRKRDKTSNALLAQGGVRSVPSKTRVR